MVALLAALDQIDFGLVFSYLGLHIYKVMISLYNWFYIVYLKRTYYRNDPRDQIFAEPKQTLDIRSRLLSFMQTIYVFVYKKNKSKQSYVWIYSIFEAQNICFGSEIAGLLDHSYNKCALDKLRLSSLLKVFRINNLASMVHFNLIDGELQKI